MNDDGCKVINIMKLEKFVHTMEDEKERRLLH